MTTDNLNPTDKLYEAGRQFDLCLSKYYLAGFSDELTDAFKEFKQAITAYEKSKEEQQSEKVPVHKCEYCGAMTEQPDEVCWNNPDRQPTQEPGETDFDLEIEGTAEILMGSDSLPANVIILSGLINRATKDLTDEVERLRARIGELESALTELIQVKEWKDKYGKDEHYLKAQPIAWGNAKRLFPNQLTQQIQYAKDRANL